MPTISFVIPEGFRLANLGSFQDLLHVANRQWQKVHGNNDVSFEWHTVAQDNQPIESATGIKITPDYSLSQCPPANITIVPALSYTGKHQWPSLLDRHKPIYQLLQQRDQQGDMIISHCTSVFLLAESGILSNRPATTAWWLKDTFAERYPHIELQIDQLTVESDNIITGAAGNSDQLLTLNLIERYMGPQISALVSKLLLIDLNRIEQTPFLTLQQQLQHNDSLVADAQTWLQNNLRESAAVSNLPDVLKVSARTLIRRFTNALGETPNRYLQNLRIDTAKRLLETTDQNVEGVMTQVGYTDLSSFSRLFQRKTGLTPRAYRHRFRI